ncbi:hypothetical protein H4CHR_04410 [Variovorax sp. PBS-H4]|uniref:hypothetical protein n=1 Tax=Variovorax sp. PBS-H4 TaxID=434008 RepID=UPI0013167ABA|nr:hypothetical protein [Variovorax sp. PBS-H4]VTU38378.1 hypothetical protein H4CHR_04410 [Variovorax sp. PBS-H4]
MRRVFFPDADGNPTDADHFLALLKLFAGSIECGDCLLWQGGTNANGAPKLYDTSARRLMWEAHHDRPLEPHELVTVTCEKVNCLHIEHLALTDKSAAAVLGNASLAVRARKSAACAKAARPFAKLDIAKVREMRARRATDTIDTLGAEFGVDRSLVARILRNESWRELASPFAGLMGTL